MTNDPEWDWMWALHNTGQTGGTAGVDIDVTDAWGLSDRGEQTVAVVDTGATFAHPGPAGRLRGQPPGKPAPTASGTTRRRTRSTTTATATTTTPGAGTSSTTTTTRPTGPPPRSTGTGRTSAARSRRAAATASASTGWRRREGPPAAHTRHHGQRPDVGRSPRRSTWPERFMSRSSTRASAALRRRSSGTRSPRTRTRSTSSLPATAARPHRRQQRRRADLPVRVPAGEHRAASVRPTTPTPAPPSRTTAPRASTCSPGRRHRLHRTRTPSTRMLDGTSMATPHVAGTLALMRAMNPTLTAAQLKAQLLASVPRSPASPASRSAAAGSTPPQRSSPRRRTRATRTATASRAPPTTARTSRTPVRPTPTTTDAATRATRRRTRSSPSRRPARRP